jgi:hypothetical protein
MHWIDSRLTLMHFLVATIQQKILPPPDLTVPESSSIDLKLLTDQINFLKDANSELHTNFSSFTTTINTTVIVIGIFLTASTFYLNRIYKNTIKELEEDAKSKLDRVQANLESKLSLATDQKIEQLKRSIRQEEVVHETPIIYINTQNTQPLEFRILEKRGFDNLTFSSQINKKDFSKKVVVLDLVNLDLNEQQKSSEIDTTIGEIENDFPIDSLLIIYCPPGMPRITKLLGSNKIRYLTMANNRITLVGAVVDSAYILTTVSI